jgi:hypothetical protein
LAAVQTYQIHSLDLGLLILWKSLNNGTVPVRIDRASEHFVYFFCLRHISCQNSCLATSATNFATTLAGTAIGAGSASLLGALAGLGIPDARTKIYSDLIEQGHYLVVVEGTDSQLHTVGEMLTRRGIQEWQIYNVASTPTPDSNHYF